MSTSAGDMKSQLDQQSGLDQKLKPKTLLKHLPEEVQQFFLKGGFKLGAGINEVNSDFRTPLLHAIKFNPKAASLLLDCPDINVDYVILNVADAISPGQSALYFAAWGVPNEENFLKIVGKSPNCIKYVPKFGMHKDSPILHTVVVLGTPKRITKLLELGCDIDQRAPQTQETPLHVAAVNGNIACLVTLIQNGARNLQNANGLTALTYAKTNGNSGIVKPTKWKEVIRILTDYETAFKIAATDDTKSMMELFQKPTPGAHFRQRNAEGETLLMIATKAQKTEMVKFLSAYEPEAHALATRLVQVSSSSSAAASKPSEAAPMEIDQQGVESQGGGKESKESIDAKMQLDLSDSAPSNSSSSLSSAIPQSGSSASDASFPLNQFSLGKRKERDPNCPPTKNDGLKEPSPKKPRDA